MPAVLDGVGRCWPLAIGIANQRETLVAWDATTGEPVHPAIGTVPCQRGRSLSQ